MAQSSEQTPSVEEWLLNEGAGGFSAPVPNFDVMLQEIDEKIKKTKEKMRNEHQMIPPVTGRYCIASD